MLVRTLRIQDQFQSLDKNESQNQTRKRQAEAALNPKQMHLLEQDQIIEKPVKEEESEGDKKSN